MLLKYLSVKIKKTIIFTALHQYPAFMRKKGFLFFFSIFFFFCLNNALFFMFIRFLFQSFIGEKNKNKSLIAVLKLHYVNVMVSNLWLLQKRHILKSIFWFVIIAFISNSVLFQLCKRTLLIVTFPSPQLAK